MQMWAYILFKENYRVTAYMTQIEVEKLTLTFYHAGATSDVVAGANTRLRHESRLGQNNGPCDSMLGSQEKMILAKSGLYSAGVRRVIESLKSRQM